MLSDELLSIKHVNSHRQDFDLPLNRPIRVVVFGGGPVLERGVKKFLVRLEEHFEIDVHCVFCQSSGQGFWSIFWDLWNRRRYLSVPLFFLQASTGICRFLLNPRVEIVLRRKIRQMSNRIYFVPDIHSPGVLDCVNGLSPDLGLIYSSPVLKPELFTIPTLGTLGIHHGKVPQYRGKKTTFWAIYKGEKTAGVTIQKINQGLDTGQIVEEGEVVIGRRSLGKVWDDLEELGFDLYIQAILRMKNGKTTLKSQQGSKGKLYRDPKFKDILVLWQRVLFRKFHIG